MKGETRITVDGRESFEQTSTFRLKVDEIKKEVKEEYSLLLLKERNWLKRLWISVRLRIETKRRIAKLSSGRNLHLVYS